MTEAFQPIAVRPPSENMLFFRLRCLADLQLLTIFRFLQCQLKSCRGSLLDVGAGEAPWRDLLSANVEYVAVDVDMSNNFGMGRRSEVTYYDGKKLPYDCCSFEHVLCTEVLEHVADPMMFIQDLHRVLRFGGSLILTVPWAARIHHLPYDYYRFSCFGLAELLKNAGFSEVTIEERGNDIAAIANKLTVLTIRLLRPKHWHNVIFTWPLVAFIMVPITLGFIISAHAALLLKVGSKEDPLGYGVIAIKK